MAVRVYGGPDGPEEFENEVAAVGPGGEGRAMLAPLRGPAYPPGAPEPNHMGDSVTPHVQMSGPTDFRYLCSGIDTLDVGFYVEWPESWVDELVQLDHHLELSRDGKEAVWHHSVFGDALVTGAGKKRNYRYRIQIPEAIIWVAGDFSPNNFPNVFVSPSAELLWRVSPDGVIEALEGMIRELGGSITRQVISRVDLAADFYLPESLGLQQMHESRVARAKKSNHYADGDKLETFYVGTRGAQIQARIYDKMTSVLRKPRSAFIVPIWGGPLPVWRVEFQLRREFLRRQGVSSLEELKPKLGGVWQYLTSEWLSFRESGPEHTSRRPVWNWWERVQEAAGQFDPGCSIDRSQHEISMAPTDWYVAHMAGCLVSLAARMDKPKLEEALEAFDEAAREAWASKCWEDEYARRRIQIGRSPGSEGENDDCPL